MLARAPAVGRGERRRDRAGRLAHGPEHARPAGDATHSASHGALHRAFHSASMVHCTVRATVRATVHATVCATVRATVQCIIDVPSCVALPILSTCSGRRCAWAVPPSESSRRCRTCSKPTSTSSCCAPATPCSTQVHPHSTCVTHLQHPATTGCPAACSTRASSCTEITRCPGPRRIRWRRSQPRERREGPRRERRELPRRQQERPSGIEPRCRQHLMRQQRVRRRREETRATARGTVATPNECKETPCSSGKLDCVATASPLLPLRTPSNMKFPCTDALGGG